MEIVESKEIIDAEIKQEILRRIAEAEEEQDVKVR